MDLSMDSAPHLLALCVLFFALGFRTEGGSCQSLYLQRPVPSDKLPVPPPKEDPDPQLDPKERDLNETELRGLLGVNFDPRFMSVLTPEERKEDAGEAAEWSRQRLTGTMPKEIRSMDFDSGNDFRKQNKKLRRRLQHWLWAHTFCPVVYTWQDMGSRYWPRFIKMPSCLSKRSCSVPEGMVCKPSKATHFTLLRYYCVKKGAALRCTWGPMQYPVISECKCSCPN